MKVLPTPLYLSLIELAAVVVAGQENYQNYKVIDHTI